MRQSQTAELRLWLSPTGQRYLWGISPLWHHKGLMIKLIFYHTLSKKWNKQYWTFFKHFPPFIQVWFSAYCPFHHTALKLPTFSPFSFLFLHFSTRRTSIGFPRCPATRRSWGIRQSRACPPRAAAHGYYLQRCPPIAPGDQGSNPRPEENLTFCQPQLQQPVQPGELGRWACVTENRGTNP